MGAVAKMFSGPKIPKVPVTRMPSQDDYTAQREAERKKAAKRSATEGRASTNLGGGDYGSGVLGQ